MKSPFLTIAIPTWNRADYLRQNLAYLKAEIASVGAERVELIVSDNCSSDSTPAVVQEAQEQGLEIRYFRNAENIGWARNFAQCVEAAQGRYLLLFGDDDVLCEGTLRAVMAEAESANPGIICVQPYGYDEDFLAERPRSPVRARRYDDPGKFLAATSQYFTLTSALVLNRAILGSVDSHAFVHTNIATFHLVLRAALAATTNSYISGYLIASKRNNSSSYQFYKVFVEEFWEIIDDHRQYGLSAKAIRTLETQRLLTYYPAYMLDVRRTAPADVAETYRSLRARFGDRALFWLWLVPILKLPKPLAVVWGVVTTSIGRLARGDLRRGLAFLRNKLLLRRTNARLDTTTSAS